MPLHYEKDDELAVFTFENGKVNPTDPQMHKDLALALRDFEESRVLKVGIMRGAGARAFSAGDDIKTPRRNLDTEQAVWRHFYPRDPEDELSYPGWERVVMTQPRFKPIVAAVRGYAFGQGLIYLLRLTDIRVAGESAKLGFPEIPYGLGGGGGFGRVHKHIPRAVAMKMLLTGEPIDAREALRLNVVNEVVPDAETDARARSIALKIAQSPLLAIRAEMETFVRGENLTDESAAAMTDHIYRLQVLGLGSEKFPIDFKAKQRDKG